MEKRDFYWTVVLGIITVFLLFGWYNSKQKVTELTDMYNTINDSLTFYQNSNGEQVAYISQIEATNASSFLDIKSKDSTIIKLQKQVNKYEKQLKPGNSIAIIGTVTDIQVVTNTLIDTLYLTNNTYTLEHQFKYNDKWISLNGCSTSDTTFIDLKVRNEYTIATFTNKKETLVELTNYNPYTTTTELRSFSIAHKQKKFSLGLQVGYGITPKGLNPYIGIGLNYNLINF